MAYTILWQKTAVSNTGTYGTPRDGNAIFGLPGLNASPAYCRAEMTCRCLVTSGQRVYFGAGGVIKQTPILNATYPSMLAVQKSSFRPQPNSAGQFITWTTVVTNGIYTQNIAVPPVISDPPATVTTTSQLDSYMAGYKMTFVGLLQDLGYDPGTVENAYFYWGGTGTYAVTNPIYPVSQRIVIPGIREALEYFPGAVLLGNSWQSCDRTGGYFRIGGTDKKNSEAKLDPTNPVNIRKSGKLVRAVLIGSGTVLPILSFSSENIDFGTVVAGTAVPPVTVTMSNATTAPTGLVTIAVNDATEIFSASPATIANIAGGGTAALTVNADGGKLVSGDIYQASIDVTIANHPDSASLQIQIEAS